MQCFLEDYHRNPGGFGEGGAEGSERRRERGVSPEGYVYSTIHVSAGAEEAFLKRRIGHICIPGTNMTSRDD